MYAILFAAVPVDDCWIIKNRNYTGENKKFSGFSYRFHPGFPLFVFFPLIANCILRSMGL